LIRQLATTRQLADVLFAPGPVEDGAGYRFNDGRTLMPASGSGHGDVLGFSYFFDPARAVWIVCRYRDTATAMVREAEGLRYCRIEHNRRSGEVTAICQR